MKGIKSQDIAQLAWEINKERIKEIWFDWDRDSWEEFKQMCKSMIFLKHGKATLKQCSPTFLGYCTHYVFAKCVNTWGRTNQGKIRYC